MAFNERTLMVMGEDVYNRIVKKHIVLVGVGGVGGVGHNGVKIVTHCGQTLHLGQSLFKGAEGTGQGKTDFFIGHLSLSFRPEYSEWYP